MKVRYGVPNMNMHLAVIGVATYNTTVLSYSAGGCTNWTHRQRIQIATDVDVHLILTNY